jgi:uncharacterized iron-regulated membrane protein
MKISCEKTELVSLRMNRHFWVFIHRYVGLAMAVFLVIVGLTGSMLAFYDEIDDWLNPISSRRHTRVTIQDKPLIDAFTLCERALALVPQARISTVNLEPLKPGEAYGVDLEPRIDPAMGQPYPLGFTHLKLNPYTGAEVKNSRFDVQAIKQNGYFPLTRKTFLPFVYALHYALALDETGGLVLGIIALAWTLDCFVGFYLTLPKGRSKHPATTGQRASVAKPSSFWQRWKPAWQIKRNASTFRLNFDLHRAFGLWTWVMLFIFAWSSVMFNLPQVYQPVMGFLFDTLPEQSPPPVPNAPQFVPIAEFRKAHAIGQRLMSEQAKLHGFAVHQESLLIYDDATGLFDYYVTSDRNVSQSGHTAVTFNADSGAYVSLDPPAKGELSGVTVQYWLIALHVASVWGLPYKLLVAMLSVTGIYIWYKKHRAARLKRKGVA